jgi:hypothetical protein
MSSMRIRWLVNPTASSLHAGAALAAGQQLTDPNLGAALAEPTRDLEGELAAAGVPPVEFWRIVGPLSTTFSDYRQLAKMTLYRTTGLAGGRELTERVGECIAAMDEALLEHNPNLSDELTLRSGPLRAQWEARGPGLLKHIFEATEARLMVAAADIVLVLPVLGGGGAAQLYNNSVRIEAVLADPHANLPEVVRLGWMLAQLHLDLPLLAPEVPAGQLPRFAALAMVPAALEAANALELTKLHPGSLAEVAFAWNLPSLAREEVRTALSQWWEAYVASRPPFNVALQTLAEVLAATDE